MPRLLKSEQPHQLRTFEQFFALGDGRSIPRLAAETGIKAQTLKLWSRSFRWRSRIAERETEVVRQVSERTMTDAVLEAELNLKLIRMAKRRLAKDISEGRAKGAFGDLVKLIELERTLLSRPDPAAPEDEPTHRFRAVVILPDDGSDPDFSPPAPDDVGGAEGLFPNLSWHEFARRSGHAPPSEN